MFGRQGSGKGTQAQQLAERYGVVHISTGDALRDAADAGTPLGLKAKELMDTGQLVPDDVMCGIVRERLDRPDVEARGFLLDGFPRTLPQAQALMHDIVGFEGIDMAVDLDISEDEVKHRMLARGRDDDTPEAIANRLELYAQETVPAMEWFDSLGLLATVDASGTEPEVTARLVAAIDRR